MNAATFCLFVFICIQKTTLLTDMFAKNSSVFNDLLPNLVDYAYPRVYFFSSLSISSLSLPVLFPIHLPLPANLVDNAYSLSLRVPGHAAHHALVPVVDHLLVPRSLKQKNIVTDGSSVIVSDRQ